MSDSRLFKILYHLLEKGHATATELADEMEVSARTIYRDIDALSGAGIPIYAEPGRNGGICLLPDFTLDRALLSEKEKKEILTAIEGLSATGYTAGRETLTKLSALFHMDAGSWLEVDFSRWGNPGRDNEKFEMLKTAVIQHREITMFYANANGEKSKRRVQPLKLFYKSKAWYLKAFCLEKQDFRLFKLHRISHLEISGQTFVPKSYPEAESGGPEAYTQIVLLFSRETAYRVWDEFDETQIEQQENGDLLIRANLSADTWLTGYLLSFGTQVKIIEPAYLREEVAAQALAIYEKNKP